MRDDRQHTALEIQEFYMKRIEVRDMSAIGEVRRSCATLAQDLDLDENTAGKASIAAVELSTNLVRHAGGGFFLLQAIPIPGVEGIEILAVDAGPGMTDPWRCASDGYSTTGTTGEGLGSVRRLSSEFDIYSMPGKGSVILCRVVAEGSTTGSVKSRLSFGAIGIALFPHDPCGDAWAIHESGPQVRVILADGLGHGVEAARAADEAVSIFRRLASRGPREIAEILHAGLRSTRGAAIGVLGLDIGRQIAKYCGIGNISARILDGQYSRQLMSHNGTAGAQAPKIEEYTYPWPDKGLCVMHSDGVAMHWTLEAYPGLLQRHPAVIAAVLYRDFARGRDDASLVVVKENVAE